MIALTADEVLSILLPLMLIVATVVGWLVKDVIGLHDRIAKLEGKRNGGPTDGG